VNADLKLLEKRIRIFLGLSFFSLVVMVSLPFAGKAANAVDTSSPAAEEPAVIVSDVRVVIEGRPERRDYYVNMARRMISIKPGDVLTDERLNATIETLTLSNRFSAIHVDSSTTPGGDALTFTLTPHIYIRDIRIRGAYPLFERDILNQMTIYPGDPFTDEDLSGQIGAIIKTFKREGYIDPKVTITSQKDPDADTAVVNVDIERGDHYVLGTLNVEGNRSIASAALKRRMGVWWRSTLPGIGRFSEYRLKNDMDSLLTYYRRKGFADAVLSYRIDDPTETHSVDVTVVVQEGPRYEIRIDGNQHFWDLTLNKDVVIKTDGNRNNIGVRKSVRNMRRRYLSAGYLNAKIKTKTTDISDGSSQIRRLRFVIAEGPRTLVEGVTIDGNSALLDKEIEEQLLTRPPSVFHSGAFVPDTFEQDVNAVNALYAKQGFQARTVDSKVVFNESKTAAEIQLDINEGPQTIVDAIAIEGLVGGVSEETARQQLAHAVGDPLRTADLELEKERLTSLIAEYGYPHTTVATDIGFSDDRTRAKITYHVDAGPKVTLGEVFISGNLRTKDEVIRRELGVETGTPLSLQALSDGQRRLRDLDIFHGVRFRNFGLKEKNETVNTFVEVEENKPFYFQLGGGYESDIGLFGRAMAGDNNLFGINKKLWAKGEVSETGYRLETRLIEPRFLNTLTTASLGFFGEELKRFNQAFGTRTIGGSLGFGRDWARPLTTTLNFSLEHRTQFRVDDDPDVVVDDQERTIFAITPTIRYDTRDSFIRPTRGGYTFLSVDFSKGFEEDFDDFVRYVFDTRYFYSPYDKITLAGMFRFGQVLPYSESGEILDDQLFYLGGIRNVRGFKQNLLRFDSDGFAVGGKTAIVGSLEARIEMGLNLELTTFFDIGSVQDALVDEGSDRFRPTVGLGLRYITPIGPMGVMYGHLLDRAEGEAAGRFYVSIGYSF